MPYGVKLRPAAERDVARLPRTTGPRVARVLRGLADEPRPRGCIKLTREPGYRIRVGDWRVLYTIDDAARLVTVGRIRHRRDAYR